MKHLRLVNLVRLSGAFIFFLVILKDIPIKHALFKNLQLSLLSNLAMSQVPFLLLALIVGVKYKEFMMIILIMIKKHLLCPGNNKTSWPFIWKTVVNPRKKLMFL